MNRGLSLSSQEKVPNGERLEITLRHLRLTSNLQFKRQQRRTKWHKRPDSRNQQSPGVGGCASSWWLPWLRQCSRRHPSCQVPQRHTPTPHSYRWLRKVLTALWTLSYRNPGTTITPRTLSQSWEAQSHRTCISSTLSALV